VPNLKSSAFPRLLRIGPSAFPHALNTHTHTHPYQCTSIERIYHIKLLKIAISVFEHFRLLHGNRCHAPPIPRTQPGAGAIKGGGGGGSYIHNIHKHARARAHTHTHTMHDGVTSRSVAGGGWGCVTLAEILKIQCLSALIMKNHNRFCWLLRIWGLRSRDTRRRRRRRRSSYCYLDR